MSLFQCLSPHAIIKYSKPAHTETPSGLRGWFRGCAPETPKEEHRMTDAKRTKSIKIRVTDEELSELRERCPAGELAPWLRELGLGQKRPRRAERVDPALLRQLAGVGNLLNQIARRINSGQWSYGDRVEILAALWHIEKRLQDININAG